VPAFADTMRLLKVWSAQRGYYLPVSGVDASKNSSQSENDLRGSEVGTPLLWTCLIGALIFGENATPGSGGKTHSKGKKGKPIMQIGRGLSSYQLFRAVMDVLGGP
jgi:U3 small nucleolar RNA-associated protein 22